jgi:hypothetical protein
VLKNYLGWCSEDSTQVLSQLCMVLGDALPAAVCSGGGFVYLALRTMAAGRP